MRQSHHRSHPRPGLAPLPMIFAVLTMAALTGCASVQELTCRMGEKPVITETLFFGTAKPGGVVGQEEWASFVNETVTPVFPEGLTSWSASGQWRMANGTIEHETSHVLQLTHDGSADRESAIPRLMTKYKQEFQQEAVLRVRTHGCISF